MTAPIFEVDLSKFKWDGAPRKTPLTAGELQCWIQSDVQTQIYGLQTTPEEATKVFRKCPRLVWDELNTEQPPFGKTDFEILRDQLLQSGFDLSAEIHASHVDLTLRGGLPQESVCVIL